MVKQARATFMVALMFISFLLFIIIFIFQFFSFLFLVGPLHLSGLNGLYFFVREILQDM